MESAEQLLKLADREATELLGREDADVAAELLEQVEPERSAKLLG